MGTSASQFRNLVLAVFDALQLDPNKTSQKEPLRLVYSEITRRYFPTRRDALVKFLPEPDKERFQSDSDLGRKVFIYLDPPDKAAASLPVLNLKCDFSQSIPDVRLRLAFFLRADDEKTASIGFRFETPHEENKKDGLHDYYHAQPFNSFFKDGDTLPCCPLWLPCKLPAFPLLAETPVELLSCMILSLYGQKGVRKVMEASRSDKELQESIMKFMNHMDKVKALRRGEAKLVSTARPTKGARGR